MRPQGIEQIEMGPYLTKLSSGLASSMVDPKESIDISVIADRGTLPTSHAVSIGLIVTELIINSVKYAFPDVHASAHVQVTFEMAKVDWKLTVADNGTGRRQADERERIDRTWHGTRRGPGEAAQGPGLRNIVAQGHGRHRHQSDVRVPPAPRGVKSKAPLF